MTLLSAALNLSEEYGLPVFPCRPDKKPYTPDGFKSATTNYEQIKRWFTEFPDALIGVPTGKVSKLMVIDVDPAGIGWYAEHAADLSPGCTNKTPRGHHLVYQMPAGEEIRNSVSVIAEGIDVRAEGGYVIWWPACGLDAVGDLSDITPPPAFAIEALKRHNGHAREPSQRTDPGAIPQGGRNAALTSLAGKMRRAGATPEELQVALAAMNARCSPPLPEAEVNSIADSVARYAPSASRNGEDTWQRFDDEKKHSQPKIVLRPAWEIVAEMREPEWLLHKIIEAKVIAVIVGARGTFKSFIGLDWLMRIAIGGKPVVILSGEGAGIDRRIDAWMRTHAAGVDLKDLPVLVFERPLNLTVPANMLALTEACEALQNKPVVIMVDTFSKFAAGVDENSNSEVAAYLSVLSEYIREAFECTVLLVAHSGHTDAKRPRGASVLMANPDAEYIVERPDIDAMTVTVSRDRFKDCAAQHPLGYEAKVIDLERTDASGDPVTSLALITSDAPAPIRRSNKGKGHNQLKFCVAIKEWLRSHPKSTHISSIDIRALCKAQGFSRMRMTEVLESFVALRILTPSAGGYGLHPENL